MLKRNPVRVQHQPRCRNVAVFGVAEHWKFHNLGVSANLVRLTGDRFSFN